MRADRKKQAAVIYAKMFRDAGNNTKTITPIADYTLPMALSDADAYYQAGTVASSLIGLSKTVANAETNADQAKAESGPNSAAVMNANATSAPSSQNTVPFPNRPTRIRDVNTPLVRMVPQRPGPTGEPTDPDTIASIRKALCLSATGSLDDKAHRRLGIYLDSINEPHSERFSRREIILLDRLIDNDKTADCALFK
jgi:hypothetical protein